MRCLVTGGTGFVGGHIVDKLYAEGYDVVAFDKMAPRRELPSGVTFIQGDVLDRDSLIQAFTGVDVVIHTAAEANTGNCVKFPHRAVSLNITGTENVLEIAKNLGVKRVIVAGSSLISGLCIGEADEDVVLIGEGKKFGAHKIKADAVVDVSRSYHLYVTTKLFQEMLCRDFHEMYGLDYTVLRYGICYGPRMTPGVVADIFIRQALKGEPLTVQGGGEQWRQYLYVEDLADAHVVALKEEAKNKTYNVVPDWKTRIIDMARTIQDILPDTEIIDTPARPHDIRVKMMSSEAIKEDLNWEATTTLREGLAKTIEWYKQNK